MVVCSGCRKKEYRRLCIKRMDAYWCEDCVVAGNHPGREAQLVGMKERRKEAFRAFAQAKVRQEETKQRAASRRELSRKRYGRHGRHTGDAWLLRDVVETTARKLRELFSRE